MGREGLRLSRGRVEIRRGSGPGRAYLPNPTLRDIPPPPPRSDSHPSRARNPNPNPNPDPTPAVGVQGQGRGVQGVQGLGQGVQGAGFGIGPFSTLPYPTIPYPTPPTLNLQYQYRDRVRGYRGWVRGYRASCINLPLPYIHMYHNVI